MGQSPPARGRRAISRAVPPSRAQTTVAARSPADCDVARYHRPADARRRPAPRRRAPRRAGAARRARGPTRARTRRTLASRGGRRASSSPWSDRRRASPARGCSCRAQPEEARRGVARAPGRRNRRRGARVGPAAPRPEPRHPPPATGVPVAAARAPGVGLREPHGHDGAVEAPRGVEPGRRTRRPRSRAARGPGRSRSSEAQGMDAAAGALHERGGSRVVAGRPRRPGAGCGARLRRERARDRPSAGT